MWSTDLFFTGVCVPLVISKKYTDAVEVEADAAVLASFPHARGGDQDYCAAEQLVSQDQFEGGDRNCVIIDHDPVDPEAALFIALAIRPSDAPDHPVTPMPVFYMNRLERTWLKQVHDVHRNAVGKYELCFNPVCGLAHKHAPLWQPKRKT